MVELKILELYAGSQCFSRAAANLGHKTFTSDILPLQGIDYPTDILDFNPKLVPFIPDLVWASPDCAAWSRAAGKVHFNGKGIGSPKTEKAKKAFDMIETTLAIIAYFLIKNSNLKFYIENPVGKLQFVDFMRPDELFAHPIIKRVVRIDQCQYGRENQKPTQIWTNDLKWIERAKCPGRENGCHHTENVKDTGDKYDRIVNKVNGKRRTSLGNLDNIGYYERAKIPVELCNDVITSCQMQINKKQYANF